MLREVKNLHGMVLHAADGKIGSVDEILFDDQTWIVRYLVVNTGGWLNGRKVLLAPGALEELDWEQRALNVNLTRSQVEDSPGLETDEPVSRQWQTDTHDYYGWPYYWGMGGIGMGGVGMGGVGMGGVGMSGFGMVGIPWDSGALMPPADPVSAENPGDAHLTSTKDMTGYVVAAQNGNIGHVEDFLVDDENWRIRYLAVNTSDWWPGNQVLLPLDWVQQISWSEGTATVQVTRDQIKNAPAWESGKPLSSALLEQFARFHAQQGFGARGTLTAKAESAAG